MNRGTATTFAIGALLSAVSICRAACIPLQSFQPYTGALPSRGPACFAVSVKPGHPVQLTIDQPEDLTLEIHVASARTLVDSFSSGRETVTMIAPGQYRIDISAVQSSISAPLTLNMSLTPAALQTAQLWADAEFQATKSRKTGSLDDIAASLELWKAAGDHSAAGRTLLKRGSALLRTEKYPEARAAFEEALSVCDAIADVRCLAEAANNSGLTASRLGDFESASKRWTEAAAAWRKLPSPLEGRTLSNLAFLYWQTGDYQRAIATYDRARLILRKFDPPGHTRVLNNLGLCYVSVAEYTQARAYFRRAIAEAIPQGNAVDAVNARINLGRAYMLDGILTRAQTILEQALAEAMKQPGQASLAGALNNLGQVLWRRNLNAEAESRFNKALTIHRALRDRRGEASDLHYLGMIDLRHGLQDTARQRLQQAHQIRSDVGLRDDSVDSLTALAEIDFETGNTAAALATAEQAIATLESVRSQVPGPALRASFYARRRVLLDLLVETAMRSDGVGEGLLAAERGRARALLDMLAEGSLVRKAPRELMNRRTNVRKQLDFLSRRLAAMPEGQGNDLRDRIQFLLAEDREIDAGIRDSVQSQALAAPMQSLKDLQRELQSVGSAMLEYHLGERRSWLWLVTADQVQVFPLPARAVIERRASLMVEPFGDILGRRRSDVKQHAFESATRELSRTLLGPLKGQRLPSRLILVLDGALHRVPFAALLGPGGKEHFGLTFDLAHAPSAAWLVNGPRPRPAAEFDKTMLAIADPVFRRLPRLPFTEELKLISGIIPAQRLRYLRGPSATAAALQRLPLRDFAILHLSTHAMIDDRTPELSRIAFSITGPPGHSEDTYLYPWQLAELQLNGSAIVLSACDTALGKQVMGEGLTGFTTSLFHAGASQLVLTLTKVDAEATSGFFSEVYRRVLQRRPAPMERSLTIARQVFARHPRWSDPYYWASFILIGRPSAEAYASSRYDASKAGAQ